LYKKEIVIIRLIQDISSLNSTENFDIYEKLLNRFNIYVKMITIVNKDLYIKKLDISHRL